MYVIISLMASGSWMNFFYKENCQGHQTCVFICFVSPSNYIFFKKSFFGRHEIVKFLGWCNVMLCDIQEKMTFIESELFWQSLYPISPEYYSRGIEICQIYIILEP